MINKCLSYVNVMSKLKTSSNVLIFYLMQKRLVVYRDFLSTKQVPDIKNN